MHETVNGIKCPLMVTYVMRDTSVGESCTIYDVLYVKFSWVGKEASLFKG